MFRMTVGKKICLGYGLAIILLVLIGGISYWTTIELLDIVEQRGRSHRIVETTGDIYALLADAQGGERGYIITGKDRYLDPYREAREKVPKEVARLKKLITDNPAQEQRLVTVEDLIDKELSELQKVVDIGKSESLEAGAREIKTGKDKEFMDNLRRHLRDMESTEQASLEKLHERAHSMGQNTLLTLLIGTLLAVVLISATGVVVVRSLAGAARQLVKGAEQFARGTLTYRIEVGTRDELGELALAFNRMAENLSTTIETEKDGRARIEKYLEGEKKSRSRIERLLVNIREATSQLTSACNEILASTTQQAAGAQEQAAAVAQTVATVDEVTQTSDQAGPEGQGRRRSRAAHPGNRQGRPQGRRGLPDCHGGCQGTGGSDVGKHPRSRRAGPTNRRNHRHRQRHRRANQPVGLERRHRGLPGGRAW
jgi:methyl-accepting chemotaxis protein